ncbi:MAG: SDR family NAD(P)-dependent oxidoreductase [Chloroflexota bacterium]
MPIGRSSNRVLVTGGCGFIGSHLVEELARRGKKVRAVGLNCHLQNLSHLGNTIEFVRGDITDREFVEEVVTPDLEGILHLAALVNVDQSVQTPEPFFNVNVLGTMNVLDAARKKGIPRLLHMSTCEVYGLVPEGWADENHPTNPRSPYAASKFSAERYLLAYSFTYDTPNIVIIRGFNQYGPRQSADTWGAVIPKFATRLLKDKPVQVNGDGLQTRDYVFVEDTVRGIVAAFDTQLPNGDIINLATGVETTIKDIAMRLCLLAGKDPGRYLQFGPARPGELRRSCGDYTKAKRLLGWDPAVSFQEGLALTFDWFRKNSPGACE